MFELFDYICHKQSCFFRHRILASHIHFEYYKHYRETTFSSSSSAKIALTTNTSAPLWTWKSLVQSVGCTTGAYDNITFNAWYALSSYPVHWNGIRCTTACNGVAKLVRYRCTWLCHRICPKNRLNALAFSRAGVSKMAFTLSGSTAIPSLLMMWPSSILLVTPKTHFVAFRLNREP